MKKITRRQFLQICGVTTVAGLVGACAQQETTIQSSTTASDTIGDAAAQDAVPADRYDEVMMLVDDAFSVYYPTFEAPSTEELASAKSGDCTLLISPDGKVMLIDAAYPDCAHTVVAFLTALGIQQIDYLVISHPHIDHIGGVITVMDAFPVKQVYRTALEYTTQTYLDYNAYLKASGVPTENLIEGDAFYFGEDILVEIFNPAEEITYPADYPDNSTQFVNNTSMAMKFTYGDSTYFSAGDLYLSQESSLVDAYGDLLQSDIIKANHHGHDTSSGNPWVKALVPQVVVSLHDSIASMTIYNRFLRNDVVYYNNALDGVMRITMNDTAEYQVITQYDSWLRDTV